MQDLTKCPHCGSSNTASRRALFHTLMCGAQPQGAFAWYGERVPQALPPKSLLVIFLILIAALAVPAVGFWFLKHEYAVTWLLSVAALTLAVLVVDVSLTYRRYKAWAGQWLCGRCREVFSPLTGQKAI